MTEYINSKAKALYGGRKGVLRSKVQGPRSKALYGGRKGVLRSHRWSLGVVSHP